VNPKEAVRESTNYVQPNRIKLVCGISEELMKEIERGKDLLSQKTGRPCSLEETIKEVFAFYLSRKDPVKRAERVLAKPKKLALRREPRTESQRRPKIRAGVKHVVVARDQGRCTHINPDGKRCEQRRWLDLHHAVPVADGGTDAPTNLTTLCHHHHAFQHELKL